MRLSPADHALIAGVALIAAPRRFPADPADVALTVSILRDVLPRISHANPALSPLREAAEEAVRSGRHGYAGLAVTLSERAIDGWNRARLAAAWDAVRGDAA